MSGTAPNSFVWINEKSRNAKAPVTRDLLRSLIRNLNHLCIRINNSDGSAEGLIREGGLNGHCHAGGDEGMVMCRSIDSRVHRVRHPGEFTGTAGEKFESAATRAIISRYLKINGGDDWEDLFILPDSGVSGHLGVTFSPAILVSPGVQYLAARVWYNLLTAAGINERPVAEMKFGVAARGASFDYGDAIQLKSWGDDNDPEFHSPFVAGFGGLQLRHNADWENRKNQMVDISSSTGRGDSRLIDVNFQVRLTEDPASDLGDAWLLIWGYTIYEVFEYFPEIT